MGGDRKLQLQLSRLSGQYRATIFRDFQQWKRENACVEGMSTSDIMQLKSNIKMKRRIEYEAKKAELLRAWTEGTDTSSNANERNDRIFSQNQESGIVWCGRCWAELVESAPIF